MSLDYLTEVSLRELHISVKSGEFAFAHVNVLFESPPEAGSFLESEPEV